MGDRRCCCGSAGCLIFQDDFNRPNSTNLGSKWREDLGNSEIWANSLRMPPSSRVICTIPHRRWDATCVARVNMEDMTEGDIFRLIIDHDDETGNYLFGEYEVGAAENGILKVGSAIAGIAQYHHSLASIHGDLPGENFLEVCRSRTGLFATMASGIIVWHCIGEYPLKPFKAGVDNPGASTISFDNFQFLEHFTTNPVCPSCYCECWDGLQFHCLPKTLLLTITASGLCACMDGWQLPLEQPEFFEEDSIFYWEGYGEIPDWDCTGGPGLVDCYFRLECDTSACAGAGRIPGWRLVHCLRDHVPCGVNGGAPHLWTPAPPRAEGAIDCWATCPIQIVCDPLLLKYGLPFTCDSEAGVCSSFIDITESV